MLFEDSKHSEVWAPQFKRYIFVHNEAKKRL